MSYDDYEGSAESGRPVEIFELRVGSDVFRLGATEETVVAGGFTYDPAVISRGDIQLGPDARLQLLTLVVPAASTFARRFVGVPPPGRVEARIRRFHRDDPDEEVKQIFKGTVKTVAVDQGGKSTLIVVAAPTYDMGQEITRYKFAGMCQHDLFDIGCKASQAAFTYSGVAGSTSDDHVITVAGIDSSKGVGWATGGLITTPGGDARAVYGHTATDRLRLLIPFRDSVVGQTLAVTAGCDHTYDGTHGCGPKFANQVNFGGCRWIPDRNIHTGGLS